jgi:two-component system cell cycle sensor histidine kinase/response regulator CckA
MSALISVPKEELARLNERVRSLARQKSSLQLVNHLMISLSTMSGLENTVEAIVRLLLSRIGGHNVSIYYRVDSRVHYANAYGANRMLAEVDDDMVRRVFAKRDVVDEMRDFSDTEMRTTESTKASYLALPLTVGGRMIGVLKLEGMLMSVAEIRDQFQPFFACAALVLNNEIGTAELQESNRRLQLELEERRRAEEALRASERRFRSLFENSPLPVWEEDVSAVVTFLDELRVDGITDLETYLSRNPGVVRRCAGLVKVLDVNRAALAMHEATRKSDLLEGLARTFLPESFPAFQRALLAFWRGETESVVEGVIGTLDGKPRDVIVHFTYCPGGESAPSKLLVSLTDITERKRAEHERELLSTIVQCSDDAIIGKDIAGIVFSWNRGAERIYGFSSGEMVGKSISVLVPQERRDELPDILRRIECGETIDHYETERVRKDGRRISVSLTISALKDAAGAVFGASTVARDISDRKHADEEIRKLNRLYVVRSRINQAIVRNRNRERLLDEACRIAVEDGLFRLVLVERADPQTRTSQIIAGRGEGDGTPVSVLRTEPCSTCVIPEAGAFREDGIIVVNDLARDESLLPCRDQACCRGCRSYAALPLRVDGQTWGTIQYYSAESSFFDEQEIQLLKELTEDVAYAIETLQRDEQRERAEDALKSSQEELSAIYEHAPIVLGLLDESLCFVRMNAETTRIARGMKDALLGRHLGEVLGCVNALKTPFRCGEGGACAGCLLQRVLHETLATGLSQSDVEVEVNLAHEQGTEEVRMVVHTARLNVGQMRRVLLCMENITARKEAEAALRESETQYRLLAENISDVIWVLDLETRRYRYISPSIERLVGFTVDELRAEDFAAAIAPESIAFVESTVPQRAARFRNERGRVFTDEIAHRRKAGGIVWTEAVTRLRENQFDGHLEMYGVSRDITERKRLEEQLRQAQKMEAVGQLAGGVAHDFNNILAATMMHLDLLRDRPDLDPEMLDSLKELQAGAERAARLTQQLLLFSRRSAIQVRELDLNAVVENLVKMLRRLLGEHIDLRFHGTRVLPLVEADAGMLEQVVVNLAVNARDAMAKGGRLTISTDVIEIDEEKARDSPERRPGVFVCLAMADTGEGMDPATLRRIFEPFFTTKDAEKGTGLGLATVFGIVKQHKGWLEVESMVGNGSTFRIFLPALPWSDDAESPGAPCEQVRGGNETILLVEDEPELRDMVKEHLEILGYRVLEAGNGKEALALWEERSPQIDLLFTDMVMPEGITGLDLMERMRATKPGLKVIISSGYSNDLLQRGAATPADVVCLPKPYQGSTLALTVRGCLDGK